MNDPRGSIWRKWDLHIHTPDTKLNNQYSIKNADVWDEFCKKIAESSVSVFGVTDYFSISNYLKLKTLFTEKYPNSNKVFLPNLEFRIDSKNSKDEHIQFHVLFSNDQKTTDKIPNFLTRLKLISTDNKNLTNKYCTDKDLTEVGFDKAMVEISTLEKKLKEDFSEDEYLIVGVVNGYGSLRPNGSTDGRGAEYAKELDKKCKVFFGTSQNVDFLLNKIEGRSQYELPPKAVFSGCDAHSFNDLDSKLGIQYRKCDKDQKIIDLSEITWIKADPTFEGLKQVVYEPEDRVKIQELEPDEKENYQVIEKVKFIDNSFTPDDIFISNNLTAIIGGKSTGKSILLRNIAQTIDPDEVNKRLSEVGLDQYPKQVSDFSVSWKDGQTNKKSNGEKIRKKIIYIPQSYLNRLVDKKEDKTSIDEIIKNVLDQEDSVKNTFIDLQNNIRQIEKEITQHIENLFYIEDDILNINEKIKIIGDKKGIETEILKLKEEIDQLKKKAGMTEEEISQFNDLKNKISDFKSYIELAGQEIEVLTRINSQDNFGTFSSTQELIESLDNETKSNIQKEIDDLLNQLEAKLKKSVKTELTKIEKKKKKFETDLKKELRLFNPLLEKAKKSKSLDEKIKQLEIQEQKLKEINSNEKQCKKLTEEYSGLISKISDKHSKIFDYYFEAKNKILKQRSITDDNNLEFDIGVIFEENSFQNRFINDVFDQRKLAQFDEVALQDYKYSKTTFKEDVEKIAKGILDKKIVLKNSFSRKEAITKLTKNWFTFDYVIKQDGDKISEMSPGKKSFVLLKLLIELDNSKCPILLDQPEDDLDNRSIYFDLVQFIKSKKKERQIIIATHNPNLVVGADAECIVVANQKGDKSKNKIYDFEYVQGALEYSFTDDKIEEVLYSQGIQEHVCDILEGGKIAFENRKNKYNIN